MSLDIGFEVSKAHLCWLVLCVTLTNLESSIRKEAKLRKCLPEIQLEGIFSFSDQMESSQPMVAGAILGLSKS